MSTDDNILQGTIDTLSLTDTVFTWYNTTNSIIELINPLNIYDVIPQRGISSARTGLSNGFLNFEVNLKEAGGLAFDLNNDYSVKLSTDGLSTEIFDGTGNLKFFAEDSSGNIKAVTLDLSDSRIFVSPTPPEGAEEGNAWYNTISGKLYIYYDLNWVEVGGGSGGGGTSNPLLFTSESAGITGQVDLASSQAFSVLGGTGINTSISANNSNILTIAVDSSVVLLTETQTLTNKSLISPFIKSTDNLRNIQLVTSTSTLENYKIVLPTSVTSVEGKVLKINTVNTVGGVKELITVWGEGGTGGSISFTVNANTGTPVSISDGSTLSILGSAFISTSLVSSTLSISLDVDSLLGDSFEAETPNLQVEQLTSTKIKYYLGSEQAYGGWSGEKFRKITGINVEKLFVSGEIPYDDRETPANNGNYDFSGLDRSLWVLEEAGFDPSDPGLPGTYIKGQLVLVPEA